MPLFAYDTTKTVRIKNKGLGLFYWSVAGGIIAYVLIYNMYFQRGYLELDTPAGAVVLHIKDRPDGAISNAEVWSYCENGECRLWDAAEAEVGSNDGVMLTTSVKDTLQTRSCKADALTCPSSIWTSLSTSHFHVAAAEDFLVEIHHSVQAPHFHADGGEEESFLGSSLNMNGSLVETPHGSHWRQPMLTFPVAVFPPGCDDDIPVKLILQTAGLSLDDPSDIGNITAPLRETGMVVHLEIWYTNIPYSGIFPTPRMRYEYRVSVVPQSMCRISEVIHINETHRILREKKGIHFEVLQTGLVGRISERAILSHLASCVGLLAVATVVVDYITLYFTPLAPKFFRAKFDSTEIPTTGSDKETQQKLKQQSEQTTQACPSDKQAN